LADKLNAAGANAIVVDDVTASARAVICLAGLRDIQADAFEINREAFRIAAKIGAGFEQDGGLFVTVQSTGGDHGLDSDIGQQAWVGGFSGLVKTAAQEWPLAVVRSLDIATNDSADEVAQRLATELLTGGADLEIGLTADGERVGFDSVARVAEGGQPVVDSQSVIVVSGGGRGVTAATAIELAQQTQTRLALLGRSELQDEPEFLADAADDAAIKKALLLDAQARGEKVTPMGLSSTSNRIQAAREIRSTLLAMQDAGSEAIYIPCDVTDVESTSTALQQVRDLWGPITGFVHGAGVLADKRLAEKTDEDFNRVFGTKVNGLRSLLVGTQDDPINMICLFSSVAARTGNAGQADYAMANEVLNRVANAEVRRRNNGQATNEQGSICVVKSIGWGPWAGGMVTPVLKAKFDEMGVALIPLDVGARAFVSEVQDAALYEVETVIGGMPQDAPLIDPGQAETQQPAVFDVTVSSESHPYLHSHQFNGGVVLPLVTVQEWFLRAASAVDGRPFIGECKKLRVLKGVPLPHFEEQATRFRVQLQPDANNPLAHNAMLFDADGVPRFAAQLVRFTDEEQVSNGTSPVASSDWQTVNWTGSELYESKLFHGPAFAAINSVESIGESGTQAILTGSQSLGWSQEDWISDPAMIDGGLQLARIWGLESVRQLTLPTAIESFILHKPGLFNPQGLEDGKVRCVLYGQPIGQSGTRSDIWFIDEGTGTILAEIHGLEMYMSSETPLEPGAIVDAV
jgi:NAD(P)-dependent dehydrogenase (short-subunit alcohol dehydrogenase family)